jgi:hypothetical protein
MGEKFTTIKVSLELKKQLEELKKETQRRSTSELIQVLLTEHKKLKELSDELGFRNTLDFLAFIEEELDIVSATRKKVRALLTDLNVSDSAAEGIITELLLAFQSKDSRRLNSVSDLLKELSEEASEDSSEESDDVEDDLVDEVVDALDPAAAEVMALWQ